MRSATKGTVGISLLITLSLLLAACSSDSDATTTSIQRDPTTSTSVVTTTTSTSLAASTAPLVKVDILTPEPLSTHIATIDLGDGLLRAPVRLTAGVEIPPGETVEVAWTSSIEGPLGRGSVLDVELSNDRRDIAAHAITVSVTSSGGGLGTATIDVIVRVPSN